MSKIIYRLAQKKDIPRAVKLINYEYKRQKNKNYFLWQYFNSYYPAILMAAFHEKNLIGMFGLVKKRLNNGEYLGQMIDLLIEKKWRGQGIFNELADRAMGYYKNIKAFVVLPNLNGKVACEKSFSMKTLIKIDKLILNLQEVLKNKKLKNNHQTNNLLGFKKNKNFYTWRFDKNPEYKYNKIVINKQVFAYTKIFIDPDTKIKYGDIVEIKLDLKNFNTNKKLIEKIIEYFKNKDIKSITTWVLPHDHLYKELTNVGFEKFPQERYFCLKITDKKLNNLSNIKNWQIQLSDTDLF